MLSDYAHTDLKNIRHVLLATGSPHHAVLYSLLVADFVLFASGAIAHMGVPIPRGFGT